MSASSADTLTVKSPFPNVINMYDGEKDNEFCFADLAFKYQGGVWRLHRALLANASNLLYGYLSCVCFQKAEKQTRRKTVNGKDNDDDETGKNKTGIEKEGQMYVFDWPFDTTKQVDKDGLVTVLRFCYGENMVLNAQNCELNCAVFAAVMRLQIKCQDEVINQMKAFIIHTAQRDVELGARLLRASVDYDELKKESIEIDKELAAIEFTIDRLHGYFDVVVTNCLYFLPPEYLNLKCFGELHSKCSEFAIRSGYLTARGLPSSNKDLSREILAQVNPEQLNSTELAAVVALKLFTQQELLDWFPKALAACERIVTEQERVCGSTRFAKFLESPANVTSIPTGTKASDTCSAFYYPAKHSIVRISNTTANPGKDLIITTLTDAANGTNEVKANILPFKCSNHSPVLHGNRAYFMQDTTEGTGNRFGYLDVDRLVFTELKALPSDAFGAHFSGCWHHGKVFAVKNNAEIWFYDPSNDSWQNSGTNAPNHDDTQHVRLLSDPEDDADHIYAMGIESKKGLHRINLKDHSVDLVSAPEAKYSILRDALLIRIDATEFAVIASLDDGGVWYSYSSKNKQWKRIYNWRPSATAVNSQNNLVYASQERHLYYHVQGEDKWSSVPVDDKTFA